MKMKEKTITLSQKTYKGQTNTIFVFRNDFFLYPPFNGHKILDDYDKNNITIKDNKIYYCDELQEGAGYKQYHNISFLKNGKYEIHIQNLRTNEIEVYTFVITNSFSSSCCI